MHTLNPAARIIGTNYYINLQRIFNMKLEIRVFDGKRKAEKTVF